MSLQCVQHLMLEKFISNNFPDRTIVQYLRNRTGCRSSEKYCSITLIMLQYDVPVQFVNGTVRKLHCGKLMKKSSIVRVCNNIVFKFKYLNHEWQIVS